MIVEELPQARRIAAWMSDRHPVEQIIDVGCGPGIYVDEMRALGDMTKWEWRKERGCLKVDDLEMRFWSNCANTFGEELKQTIYLDRMGFPRAKTWNNSGFGWDAEGKSIVDIGGGPVSALLKMENLKGGLVVDPGEYPEWVTARYAGANIRHCVVEGERWLPLPEDKWEVGLVYNCLQHTVDPAQVIKHLVSAVGSSNLRVFEWINIPPHEGHPHMLTAEKLEEWCGRAGRVETFTGINECYGTAWILGSRGALGAAGPSRG